MLMLKAIFYTMCIVTPPIGWLCLAIYIVMARNNKAAAR